MRDTVVVTDTDIGYYDSFAVRDALPVSCLHVYPYSKYRKRESNRTRFASSRWSNVNWADVCLEMPRYGKMWIDTRIA